MRNPVDSRVHFSDLKLHSHCPAMVAWSTAQRKEPTRAMTVGAVADALVFGQRTVAVYPGRRTGSDWLLFEAAHRSDVVCIQSEYDDAKGAADAVLADPVAHVLMAGCLTQTVLQWESHGLPRATGIAGDRGGVDAFIDCERRQYVLDLKITDSEPETLSRHALRQLWHAQLADYRQGLRANGHAIDDAYLIAVRPTPPHLVTCLRVPEHVLGVGEKLIAKWSDAHRACELSGQWPGYAQAPIDMIVPEWAEDHVELEGLE